MTFIHIMLTLIALHLVIVETWLDRIAHILRNDTDYHPPKLITAMLCVIIVAVIAQALLAFLG